jgi:hypothetical protein
VTSRHPLFISGTYGGSINRKEYSMRQRTLFLGVIAAAALAVGVTALAGGFQGGATSALPEPGPPSAFSSTVDNEWLPLPRNTVFTYRGVKDGQPSRDVVTITDQTATINGYPCAVVRDNLYLNGVLAERTTDWYTEDSAGNVWYFGEDTAELDKHGRVTSTEGSWQAGVDGAKPGIFMPAHPKVGDSGQQELYPGHAEDHFRVLDLHASVSVPYVSSNKALLTEEWTPLEPGVLDHKYYVRGIGMALEQTVQGGDERNELVSVTRS